MYSKTDSMSHPESKVGHCHLSRGHLLFLHISIVGNELWHDHMTLWRQKLPNHNDFTGFTPAWPRNNKRGRLPLLWLHSRILLNSVVELAVGEWPSPFMLPWRCTLPLNACLLWQCKSSPNRWHCQLEKPQLRALLWFKCLMKNPMLKSEQVFLLKKSKRTCSCSFPLHSTPSSLSHQQRCVY